MFTLKPGWKHPDDVVVSRAFSVPASLAKKLTEQDWQLQEKPDISEDPSIGEGDVDYE